MRQIAADVVAPAARRIANGDERVDGFPRDVFEGLAAAGLFRLPYKSEVGGDGLSHPVTATAVAIEELAYCSSSVAAIFDVHCILAGNALAHGTEEQQQAWLTHVADGSMIGAFATTEPEASSDLSPQAIQTVANRTDQGWVLNGHKRWISNSPVADFIVTLARTGDRLSMFIVDTTLPGVSVGMPDQKMGNRGQLTADVRYDNVQLGDDALLGGVEGQGLRHALATLTLGRIGIAAAGVGMAQAAFDHAIVHLSERRAFGRPIAANQHWQFLMADRATESRTRALCISRRRCDETPVNFFPNPKLRWRNTTPLAFRSISPATRSKPSAGLDSRANSAPTELQAQSRRSTATAKSARSTKAPTKFRSGLSPAISSVRKSPVNLRGRPPEVIRWQTLRLTVPSRSDKQPRIQLLDSAGPISIQISPGVYCWRPSERMKISLGQMLERLHRLLCRKTMRYPNEIVDYLRGQSRPRQSAFRIESSGMARAGLSRRAQRARTRRDNPCHALA